MGVAVSEIYSLSNQLSTGGHDRPSGSKNLNPSADDISLHSSLSGLSRTEEQRLQIRINIVYTVTGLVCKLKDENVMYKVKVTCCLIISLALLINFPFLKITRTVVPLLIQRLRNDSPFLEEVILETGRCCLSITRSSI